MKIGNVIFVEKAFDGWSLEKFKEYHKSLKGAWDSTGLTADQLAKKLGIVKEKVEQPSK